MNERGEITTLGTLLLFALMGLVLLCALELKRSYRLLEKRTQLFLCVKETKGELEQVMKFIGQSNWGIRNLQRASMIAIIIPGAQGVSTNAQKLKKYLQYMQEMKMVSYVKKLSELNSKSCAIDPRMYTTPFRLGSRLLARDGEGAAMLREIKWTYGFFSSPYFISVKIDATGLESSRPKLKFISEEKMARLSFLSYLH
jgi:hypothetical protein